MSVAHSISPVVSSPAICHIERARRTLFEGLAMNPRHIHGALHKLLDEVENHGTKAGSARNLLHRAKNQQMVGGGALKRYMRIMITPTNVIDLAAARRAKQERNKKNREIRSMENAQHRKGGSGGGEKSPLPINPKTIRRRQKALAKAASKKK